MAEVQLFGDYLNLNGHSMAARGEERRGRQRRRTQERRRRSHHDRLRVRKGGDREREQGRPTHPTAGQTVSKG